MSSGRVELTPKRYFLRGGQCWSESKIVKIRRILYAADMDELNFSEVERLIALRKLGLEEVIFLNSSEAEDWDRKMAHHGLKSKTLSGEAPALSKILDAARQEAVSMVAASLKRGAKGVFSGSLIKNLLRSSPVPVFVLNEGAQISGTIEKGVFHHVIFSTDWSLISENSMAYLLNFKGIIGELEIVTVVNKKLSVRDMRNLKRRLTETRKVFLDEGIDAEAHVYAGKPSEEIILAAKDYNATSIIMGTSRKSRFKEFFCGSCSYRVAEEAAVPTLVIPLLERRI